MNANPSAVPTVSVLMPCWNRERFIGDAIRSILAQTFTDLELIVVDDGSTDGTRAVVASFDDPRLRCLSCEHRGISAAMNAGLAAAQGKFIARLDSDDWWMPDMLATQIAMLDARPDVGLVYARGECTDSDWKPLSMAWGYPLRYPDQTFRSI
jgi:glycosyltransferase involved in cell wall biosynthesis